jgi:hypothetical protein
MGGRFGRIEGCFFFISWRFAIYQVFPVYISRVIVRTPDLLAGFYRISARLVLSRWYHDPRAAPL